MKNPRGPISLINLLAGQSLTLGADSLGRRQPVWILAGWAAAEGGREPTRRAPTPAYENLCLGVRPNDVFQKVFTYMPFFRDLGILGFFFSCYYGCSIGI